MKILYVTTIGITMGFFKPFIRELLDSGHTVDIATNENDTKIPECYREWGCKIYQISTSRSPLSKNNLSAIKQIKAIVTENKYEIVHCHTPVAAMCTRLACRTLRKSGVRVIYTAHGFHFYKGSPLKNWLIFYPVEKICSYFTDTLVTINLEDYALAQKKMSAKKIEYVPGVGIDLARFGNVSIDKFVKRTELGIPEDAILLLSVGELNRNKNHEAVIRAIQNIPNTYYIIAGVGELQEHLQTVAAELGLTPRVKLLGYRRDVGDLCAAADIFAFPSLREGLPVSVMEAMASGLPVACSKIRGNTDLIDEQGGVLFDPIRADCCKDAILSLLEMNLNELGQHNRNKIKNFSIEKIHSLMLDIYNNL